jgi:hypothetical protein
MQFLASARAVQWKRAGFRVLSSLMLYFSYHRHTSWCLYHKISHTCGATITLCSNMAFCSTGTWLAWRWRRQSGHCERPIDLRKRQGCLSPGGNARIDFPPVLGMLLIVLLGCICTWTALCDCHTNVLAIHARCWQTLSHDTLLSERSNNPSACSASRDRHPYKFWRGQLAKN